MPWEESSKKRKLELPEISESSKKRKLELQEMSQPIPSAATLKAVNELLIPYMADMVQSYDNSGWLPATVWFCILLSGPDPPIARVLPCDVLTSLLLFLTEENIPELQVEAAKALKLIACGTSQCLKMTIDEVHPSPSEGMMIDSSPVNSAQDTICHLFHTRDGEVLRHACCSLAVLSGCENVKIRQLIRVSGVHKQLLEYIRRDKLVAAALRILGNMVEGDSELIDHMIRDEVLRELRRCLDHEYIGVRKEACWVISYISAGNEHCKEGVIKAGLIEPLVKIIEKDKLVVMVAALQAISNAASGATLEQIRSLVTSGCIEILCHLFCCRNTAIFEIALKGIESILDAGEKLKRNAKDVNPYTHHIANIKGWVVLSISATYYGQRLHKKVLDIFKRYRNRPVLGANYLKDLGYSICEDKQIDD